jgi:hypothetical protein
MPGPWVVPASAHSLSARFWRLCDALATAGARPRNGLVRNGLILLGRRTRLFDRPAAALNLVDSIVPGTVAAWARLALRGRRLPLRCSELELLAFGTGDTVFRLGPPASDSVLKVERLSLGLPVSELTALAHRRQAAMRDVLRQYRRAASAFPSVQFLVIQSPLFGVPAVAALQPYVEGPFRDLLRDVPDAEIERMVARVPRLRADIAAFFECTIAAWERGGWVVDLGRDNVVLAGEGDGAKLVYLDIEMKEVAGLRGTARESMYEGIVDRMREILRAIGPRANGLSSNGLGASVSPPEPADLSSGELSYRA